MQSLTSQCIEREKDWKCKGKFLLEIAIVWRKKYCKVFNLHRSCTLGWSDFHFFRFSKMGPLLSIVYIFMGSFLISPRARGACAAKFAFFKSQRPWKWFFFYFQKPSFYIKEQLSKIEFKIRICLVFFSSKIVKIKTKWINAGTIGWSDFWKKNWALGNLCQIIKGPQIQNFSLKCCLLTWR